MASTTSANPVADIFSVKGMVALVTGGGTGIGLMITKALAQAGAAKIYIAGRRLNVLEAAAAQITPLAPETAIIPITCDVTSQASLTSLVSQIESETGFLNLLFANSGIGGPQVPQPGPVANGSSEEVISAKDWAAQHLAVPMDDFTQTFAVNVASVWYTAMACLDLLDKGNKQGNLGWTSQVIVTSSIAGYNKKAPGGYAYGCSKAATTHAIKQLAVVLPTWGIRANGLAPGLFPSEMSAPIVERIGGAIGGSDAVPISKSIIPLGRTGDETDMIGTVLYMVSRAGAYCNGNIVLIDGGRLVYFPTTF
ncbi:hypothetical protein BD289DRAFT_457908 [Coniella lustricola]|uniref:Uncharacterized protein n=1 Tax=Coniella lustricola TaxID=2025994 RepID=A0A2T3AM61_9PEZI|nr:hypothetical protein BD289DRAFT_457908 [Coniella lustricola]